MASDKTPKTPKLGDTVHAVTRSTTTNVRNCQVGTYHGVAEIPRSSFPEGELGDRKYKQHVEGDPAKITYVLPNGTIRTLAGTGEETGPCFRDPLALHAGGYHLPEECPYGL